MKKILVVEDSKAQQVLVVGLLKTMGVEVFLAKNGREALIWLIEHGTPDLILMDIIMPDINGYDLCRKIRQELKLQKVPIIFCSDKSQQFDRFWALRQGGNAYLTKPYSPNDLFRIVKEHLPSLS